VLLSLLSALRGEGIPEAVEIPDLRCCQNQLSPPLWKVSRAPARQPAQYPTRRNSCGPLGGRGSGDAWRS
jgi:hypothetical protein